MRDLRKVKMLNKETEELEFKKTTAELKEGVISLSSMLNKHGHGVLYFGVKNDGSIFGLQIGKDTTSDISKEIKNHIRPIVSPTISVEKISDKQVIKIEAYGEDKPYAAYGRYFLRSDDEDLQMTNTQLEDFFINKNFDYSEWENKITDFGEEVIDEQLLINYINKGNEIGRIPFLFKDTTDALTKLGLMKNEKLNNAGLYLFSTLKLLTLKMAIYPTDERISFIDSTIFKGNIFECIDAAYQYIDRTINWNAQIIDMKRVETPEVPIEAIREIVVNSFAHMKVNNSSFNEIYITPTKIHIYNPGFLVKGKSPLDFANGTDGPIARNPLINTVLYLNKTIESFGTGFGRVFNLCKKHGISTNYKNNDFGFVFEFIRKNYSITDDIIDDTINDTINQKIVLTPTEEDVLNTIKNNNRATRLQISKIVNKSEPTVQRAINKLVKNKYIIRVGSNKNGFWEVLD